MYTYTYTHTYTHVHVASDLLKGPLATLACRLELRWYCLLSELDELGERQYVVAAALGRDEEVTKLEGEGLLFGHVPSGGATAGDCTYGRARQQGEGEG